MWGSKKGNKAREARQPKEPPMEYRMHKHCKRKTRPQAGSKQPIMNMDTQWILDWETQLVTTPWNSIQVLKAQKPANQVKQLRRTAGATTAGAGATTAGARATTAGAGATTAGAGATTARARAGAEATKRTEDTTAKS